MDNRLAATYGELQLRSPSPLVFHLSMAGGEGRRQVGVGGVRWLRATHIAYLPFFHMVVISAAPGRNGHGMERRECVRIRRRHCPRLG